MTDPYRPPEADVADAPLPPSRTAGVWNAATAFASAAVLGPLLIHMVAFAVLGKDAAISPELRFWVLSVVAGGLAAMVAYPWRTMPIWLAVITGLMVLLTVFVGYWLWIDVLQDAPLD